MAMAQEEIHVALHKESQAPTIGHSGIPEPAELETQLALHAKLEALQTVTHRRDLEFADLVPHLALQSDWAQKNIKHLLYQEYARSFKNVVGQWAVFREIISNLVAVNQSPEAEAFRQLVREIHPSRVVSLKKLADSIDKETSELKELITNQDFTRLEGRLKRFGAKATDGGTEALPRKSVTVHVAAAEAKAAQAVAAHDAAAVTSGNHALQAASGTEVARCGTGHVPSRFYNCRCNLRCSWCSSQRDVWGRRRGSVCFVQYQLAAGGLIHPPHFFGNCKRMLDI